MQTQTVTPTYTQTRYFRALDGITAYKDECGVHLVPFRRARIRVKLVSRKVDVK